MPANGETRKTATNEAANSSRQWFVDALAAADRAHARERLFDRCREGRASVFRCREKLFLMVPADAARDLLGERGADALLRLTVDSV